MANLRTALLLLALTSASARAAVSHTCESAAVRALGFCVQRAATVQATARLRSDVLARCTDATVRAGGFAPPFAPAELATRLERACLGNARALVARGADALPGSASPGCLSTLSAQSIRLAVRVMKVKAACVFAGSACDLARVSSRLDAAAEHARRSVIQRCGLGGATQALVNGVMARVPAQATCALAEALPAAGSCAPSGAEALTDLWRLATPRPPGTSVAQVSSYDRTGGTFDQGVGPDTAPYLVALGLPLISLDNSFLYQEGDRYVIFDELGPGVVWRIWMTGLDAYFGAGLGGDIAIEVDGETVPRVQLTRTTFFSGVTPPFLAPLAGNDAVSSGGFYSILPVPFARRLRISTSLVPNWLQVTFSRLPPDQAVASFDPAASTAAVASLLGAAGDPSTTVTPTVTDTLPLNVGAGTTQTLWSRNTGGTIVRFELLAPPAADVPLGLRLHATFDDAPAPQVDAPLDDLFGASLGQGARSIAFGRDGDRYYCYFPMPFASAARLELVNQSGIPFTGWTLQVGTVPQRPPGPLAHFHATAASAHLLPDGRDYVLLDTAASGHVVGIVVTAGCAGVGLCELPILQGLNGTHLEGDERTTVDGSRWPQLHGTGFEDIFNGGFYFSHGAFLMPTHGNPVQAPTTSARRPGVNLRSAYRLFLGEAIPFERGIRVAIEHGPADDVPAEFSSLTFYYTTGVPTLAETDLLTLGNPADEAAHALTADQRTDAWLVSAFRGDDSDVPVTASVMTSTVSRFDLTVAPANHGVRLRRLADIGAGAQAARILVNGALAGVWQTTEVNPVLRWAEVDFELPETLTAGRGTLSIEIDAHDSPTPWTAAEYRAFVHGS